ncbi:longevity assurance proteins LAG1/LAC1 [Aspergillus lucknowensis]|uniref:Longevity assurance proteins LAG1/LAC1 n=1 Tax=Aspergillus lucknowensis TaxID=176173 RepID=A0ABR4LYD3_9EURO
MPYKQGSGASRLFHWLVSPQDGLSLVILAVALLAHLCIPAARENTSGFFLISHYNPETQRYAIGRNDASFLAFCVILFTALRAILIKYLLGPLARRCSIFRPRDVTRFSEQAWLLCYYTVFWTLGLYIYCTSKYFLDQREMFSDWPTRELPGLTKCYILGQWAFWIQQLIIVNIEERRKDHWQMVAHHLVTLLLIYTSYVLHLTRVANVILILMDVVDLLFPLAKCLKYAGFSTLRDTMFGIFMLAWFLARHVLYCITMYGIFMHMPREIRVGCYHGSQDTSPTPLPLPAHGWTHMLQPFWNPGGTICYSDSIRVWFLGALGFLQLLTVMWFVLIVRVAVRVVKGFGADDIRSGDEDEGDADADADVHDEEKPEDEAGVSGKDDGRDIECKNVPLQTGVGAVERETYCRPSRGRVAVNRGPAPSSVSLSGQHYRKEHLGRIGCEKKQE